MISVFGVLFVCYSQAFSHCKGQGFRCAASHLPRDVQCIDGAPLRLFRISDVEMRRTFAVRPRLPRQLGRSLTVVMKQYGLGLIHDFRWKRLPNPVTEIDILSGYALGRPAAYRESSLAPHGHVPRWNEGKYRPARVILPVDPCTRRHVALRRCPGRKAQ